MPSAPSASAVDTACAAAVPRRTRLRRRLLQTLLLALSLLTATMLLDLLFPLPLPQPRDAGAVVVAADGTPLRAFADRDGVWRYPVEASKVSPLYLQALLNYEDRWFWKHPGINPLAMLRAAGQWLRSGRVVSGGSTLTMQVARILDARPGEGRRSLGAKLRQVLRALQLEAHLSKREILALYLDRAPFGGTVEGVEAASWAYLGKPSARLSHAEAALLTVLPQSPSRLRPDREPERARIARDKVLARMAALRVWTPAQVADARVEPVVARSLQPPRYAPLLAQRLRSQDPKAARIVSTVDLELQRTLEDRVSAYFSTLPERTSAALLVVDNASLEARAYVGSVTFGDAARLGHVDMVQAWRSPGSTLKPFLYGLALDDGLIHSESLFVDAPQAFGGYRPGNFDAAFNGPVGAATALRLSLNVPAVDLLERVGPSRFSARLAHAGIDLHWPRGAAPNLAMILGGTGARLEDLVGAYAAFNRNGVAGRVRYRADAPRLDRRLLSPGAAWIVREILEANPRPGSVEQTFDPQGRPRVAWKTGTSYGFRDAWALGSTRHYTVGVWVGRPDGTPLPGQYGAVTALPLLFEVVDSLPRQRGDAALRPPPRGVEQIEVCWPLGLPPDPQAPGLCQRRMQAWTLDGSVPPTFAERDARLWSAGVERFEADADSGLRLSAECARPHRREAREIARWPALASPWLPAQTRRASQLPALAPDCSDDGRDAVEELRIEGIDDQATLARAPGSQAPLRLSVRALGSDARVRWLLDGRLIGESQGRGRFEHDFGEPGEHVLTALADTGAWSRVRFKVLR
ncbi:penicillin-binding protein 1C [Lysobacter sp. BMK333-48F3]|uniref:penicillin-binding protein 1C n=1 Tax=Lysobacter sp. BMK333-48F3 TaxID=2867962 RepID=UPI001C8B6D12|nr:penicillin-binding protein 1C [Lysobacter sp. BMK333-48F3]MBX9403350.1 penicillin-binding protein 1C [Lysobacter sp. BMK333-48F3]